MGPDNLRLFAEAGGRIFSTHYSYVWLDPAYGAQFGNVANWTLNAASLSSTVQATVQRDFNDGIILADWLKNIGSTISGSADQVGLGNVRVDVNSTIAPAQSWVELNSGAYSSQGNSTPVMQMTFNVPFGSPAASQCGRVMFNDYHVIDLSNRSSNGKAYPTECTSYSATAPNNFDPAYKMSPQEQMLEYALFDLSGFVQPTVVPTINVTFNPSPLTVYSGETGVQLVVNVASGTNETDGSALLSFTLPTSLTVTAMSDTAGGWNCTVATASCSRNTPIAANATDSVTLTLSEATYTTLANYTDTITATVSSALFSSNPSFTEPVIYQQAPAITWPTPAPIIFGTPLGATQLDASTTVAGAFTYTPPAGTVLAVGQHTLNVSFAPTDTTHYVTSTGSVTITVLPSTPNVGLTSSASPVFLTTAVTFTATVPSLVGTPGGSVIFYDGATQIGTANLSNGSASVTTSSLSQATHSITVAYSGDSNYGPATSAPLTEVVEDFTLAAAGGGSATVAPTGLATFTLTVTPVGGSILPGAIGFANGTLPFGATSAFQPGSVAAFSSASSVVFQVQLPGKAELQIPAPPTRKTGWPVLALTLLLLPLGRIRRFRSRLRGWLIALVALTALAAGVSGCGGSLTPQSYTITVTAASGNLSHNTTVTLTVL